MISNDPRLIVSEWGHLVISNPHGADWRVTHGREYSVNAGVVGSRYAQRFQQNIISHHEHHLALTLDRYGRYVVVANGMLADPNEMMYAQLDDGSNPTMKRGFTLYRNGYVTLFGEHITDWDAWL